MTLLIHVPAHSSYVVQAIFAFVFLFGLKCAAMDLKTMDQMLGAAVLRCLQYADITILEAAAIMKIEEAHFRKALRGEGYRNLALNHLIKLGPLFMSYLTAELMWLTAKQRATEILETVQELKRGA